MPSTLAARLPTGTVTFLITDIEGSTKLLLDAGEEYGALLERHDALLRKAIEDHGGTLVSTAGDSIFAVFPLVGEAVAAAVAAQRALASEPWPGGRRVMVRMGLHTGEGLLGGEDYIGLDVHRTARIGAAAHGCQIIVSAATAELLAGRYPLRDLGQHRLKDLVHPEHLFQVQVPGGPAQFPAPRSLGGARTILPMTRTSYVPRAELDVVIGLLRRERLVTLTGPGGTGKTRLAIEVGRRIKDDFGDGVAFVELSPLQEAAMVAPAVLETLGVEPGAAPPRQRLVDFLGEQRLLLILDNFEHVISGADVVAAVIEQCPAVRILATSRSPLRISAEQEFPVPPLPLPDPGADVAGLQRSPAVRLFVERARRVDPAFMLTPGNAAAVATIARLLDGLPLALELAAVRVRLLPPEAIAERLQSFGAADLVSRDRDVPERQRTLEAAIRWSYDLLPPAARTTYEQLSVFAGSAGLEQIAAVLNCADQQVLEALNTLVEESLLRQEGQARQPRFGMLRTIAHFAADRLAESGAEASVRTRHVDAYLALAEAAAPHLTGWDQRRWLDKLERDHDNLRAALDRCVQTGDGVRALRLIAALWRFLQIRGHLDEAAGKIGRILELDCPDPQLRARALEAAGGLAWWRGEMAAARVAYAEALAILEPMDDLAAVANARYNLGLVLGFEGTNERGRESLLQARREAQQAGDRSVEAWAVWGLSDIGVANGDWAAAANSGEEALRMFRELDEPFGIGWSLFMTAASHTRMVDGDTELARRRFQEGIRLFAGFRDLTALTLHGRALARLEAISGRMDRALRLIGASQVLREQTGAGLLDVNEASLDAFDSVTTEALASAGRSPEEVRRVIAEGAQLSPDEAVAYIMEELAEPAAAGG